MTATQRQIQELLDADLAEAGEDPDRLRRLEDFLQDFEAHPLVGPTLREISMRIIKGELT